MKRAVLALLLVLLAVPSFAEVDPRTEKKRLIAELIEVIDAKRLTQASFEVLLGNLQRIRVDGVEDEEQKAMLESENERMKAFRDRLFTRIDYAKLVDDVYAPMFDKHFTSEELKDLIAFFKTKAGQKLVVILPEFGVGRLMQGNEIMQEATASAQEEMENEENAKHPWRKTMADIRSLATALEARATDVNEYPKSMSLDELEPLVSPVYIKTMPRLDAWGTPFLYVGDAEHYRIVSAGADKRFEWNARQLETDVEEPRVMEDLDADIIFADGNFIQFPKASQQNP